MADREQLLNTKRIDGGPWQRYSYDGLQVIAEGTGTSDRVFYTNAPGAVGGIVCRDATGAGGEKYFYHFDRLGNVVGITDAEGEVVGVYNQSAFGYFAQAFDGTGYAHAADPQPYHLTTKELDPDVGLYYFAARWYDPAVGRFVSPELLSVFSDYSYCMNGPTEYVDADGMAPATITDRQVISWITLWRRPCTLGTILSVMWDKGCSSKNSMGAAAASVARVMWFKTQPVRITDREYRPKTFTDLQTKLGGYTDARTGKAYFFRQCNDLCTAVCTCAHEYVHVLQIALRMKFKHARDRELPAFAVAIRCNWGMGLGLAFFGY